MNNIRQNGTPRHVRMTTTLFRLFFCSYCALAALSLNSRSLCHTVISQYLESSVNKVKGYKSKLFVFLYEGKQHL